MRWVLLLATAALLLAPHAFAQSQIAVALSAQPPPDAIAPLGPPTRIPLTLTASCPPGAAAPPGLVATLDVTRLPPWARAAIDPQRMSFDGTACVGHDVTFHAMLSVVVDEQAPAFVPMPLEVHATVQAPASTPAEATHQMPIVAGFSSILDVRRSSSLIAPDETGLGEATLKVANLGNAPTKVFFDVVQATPDLAVAAPPSLVLASRQGGGTDGGSVLHLRLQRIASGDLPSSFTLRYRSAYALDMGLPGDSGELAFQVQPDAANGRSAPFSGDPGQRNVPAGALLLASIALGIAALARRR